MKQSDYRSELGLKTRILNFFRRVLMIRAFENFLVRNTMGRDLDSIWVRSIPPNYLYPRHSIREATRFGIKYSLDISDYLEHAVYFGYRDNAQEELFKIAENRRVIIDVGVNIGSTSLNFARISPDATILGFEPDAANYQKARKNIELNGFSNLEVINKGLGPAAATVRLFKVNTGNAGMNRILPEDGSEVDERVESEEIEIVALDDFAAARALATVDLIKIDVEGYELNVLRGARRTLEQYKPALFIELDDNNLRAQGDSAASLLTFLEGFGYEIRRGDNKEKVAGGDDFGGCHFDIICENRD
jgi:FkbM family methyltransferase